MTDDVTTAIDRRVSIVSAHLPMGIMAAAVGTVPGWLPMWVTPWAVMAGSGDIDRLGMVRSSRRDSRSMYSRVGWQGTRIVLIMCPVVFFRSAIPVGRGVGVCGGGYSVSIVAHVEMWLRVRHRMPYNCNKQNRYTQLFTLIVFSHLHRLDWWYAPICIETQNCLNPAIKTLQSTIKISTSSDFSLAVTITCLPHQSVILSLLLYYMLLLGLL